jgi:hypothetical protein
MRWESLLEIKPRKKKDYFLVGCKARGLPKWGYWCLLAIKTKKREKKVRAASFGLKVNEIVTFNISEEINYCKDLFSLA